MEDPRTDDAGLDLIPMTPEAVRAEDLGPVAAGASFGGSAPFCLMCEYATGVSGQGLQEHVNRDINHLVGSLALSGRPTCHAICRATHHTSF